MDEVFLPIFIVGMLFIGLPWLVFHYITKWKTAATLTTDDETMLEELYQLARRLDERMDTVERLVSADNPEFQPRRIQDDRQIDNEPLRAAERLMATRGRTAK